MPCLPVMQTKSSTTVLRRFAPAKINLYLHVTGQRPNGYHELDSLVAFASVGDEVSVSEADGLTLEVEGPEALALQKSDITQNLVFQAAMALKENFSVSAGAAITLRKSLPVASGMGGGSADAAATLNALVALWKLEPVRDELAQIALKLGADVPVCLIARPQRMTGIGEILGEVPTLPLCHLVLANPGCSQSTPEVFTALHDDNWRPSGIAAALPGDLDFLSFITELKSRHNDLERPAIKLLPVIEKVMSSLAAQSGCRLARMSGSGATCFGLFETEEEAAAAAATVTSKNPDWWVKVGQLGDRIPDLRQAYTG
jgi:4-diphosphocytidyl-2-C-methyl-D-erythritol kinase